MNVNRRLGVFFEYRTGRQKSVAGIVALPSQDQYPPSFRKPANLLDIVQDRRRHRQSGSLHRRPLPRLVAGKKPVLELPRLIAAEDGISQHHRSTWTAVRRAVLDDWRRRIRAVFARLRFARALQS